MLDVYLLRLQKPWYGTEKVHLFSYLYPLKSKSVGTDIPQKVPIVFKKCVKKEKVQSMENAATV